MGGGTEDRERGELHEEADDGEHDVLSLLDHGQDLRHLLLPEVQQCGAHQAGQHQDLQQRVLGERADRAVRQRLQDELGGGGQLPAARLGVHRALVQGRRVDMHPGAGREDIAGQQTDDERDAGRHLEPDQGLDPDPAKGLEITRLGDTGDDDAEDQRRDHRLDQTDEAVTERLERRPRLRPQASDEHTEDQGDEYLREQAGAQEAACAAGEACGGVRHGHSSMDGFCDAEVDFRDPPLWSLVVHHERGPCNFPGNLGA